MKSKAQKVKYAKEIYEIRNKVKELKEKEDMLVKSFKEDLEYGSYVLGDVEVTFSENERRTLDKEKVENLLGKAKFSKCFSKQTFDVLSLKEVK